MEHSLFVTTLITGFLGCLLLLISMATPGWGFWTSRGVDVNAGLFVVCARKCETYDMEGGGLIKASIVIAWICSTVGLVVGLLYYFRNIKKSLANRNLSLAVGILYIVAGALGLLGCIIFAAKIEKGITIGYSFGMAIVGAIVCLVTGGLTLVYRRRHESQSS